MGTITTYRKISEIIINQHYGDFPMQNANLTTRHVAELVATKVAKYAKQSAFENSNDGSIAFANDQFISVYNNQPLLTDAVTNEKYIKMPATPAGLPGNREVVQVSFVGCPGCHVVPMRNKDDFFESLLTPVPFSLYKIENGNIVFRNLPVLVTNANAPVNIKMVGAVPGNLLLDSVLNIPKDVEDEIRNELLVELAALYKVPQNNINNSAA